MTPILYSWHWLPIDFRILFEILVQNIKWPRFKGERGTEAVDQFIITTSRQNVFI